MDFSLKRPDEGKPFYESDAESDIQLVFIPGLFNPCIWKHQVKYYAEDHKVFSFPADSYMNQKEALEQILDREETRNAVIVSQGLGNSLSQEFEYREEVIATVNTGVKKEYSLPAPRSIYDFFWGFSKKEPKVYKKLFFSNLTDYRVARNFLEDVEKPDYSVLKSFVDSYSLRKPVKNALVIHADRDRFSSLEEAQEFGPNVSISVIRNAGSFSFYEKPQEYNKALLDFLQNVKSFVEKREISKTREKNRSLEEFSNPSPDPKSRLEKKKPRIEK